jgi:lipid II:glycine glycyltransferase (peptidoglycan interpeptide bridge formation enzyme)
MKSFGSPQHSKKYFKNLFEFGKDSIFSGFNCYKDNTLAGSIIILHYGEIGYVAFNVSNPNFRDCRPNDFLYWNAIKGCIKNKLTKLDLGQVEPNLKFGTRARGLYKFKMKWLGETYERNYFRYNPQGAIEISGKSKLKRLRSIWKLLPLWVIKLIGPKICSELGI